MSNVLVFPMIKLIKNIRTHGTLIRYRSRISLYVIGGTLGLAVLLFLVPVPYKTQSEGVVWADDKSQLLTGADCFVTEVFVSQIQAVVKGQTLLQCDPVEITAEYTLAVARLAELEAQQRMSLVADKHQHKVLSDEIARQKVELAIIEEKLQGLKLMAPIAGAVHIEGLSNLEGRFLPRGTYIGYVKTPADSKARVVVAQESIADVRSNLHAIDVLVAGHIQQGTGAVVVQQMPSATSVLPSHALAVTGGGNIVLDPEASSNSASLNSAGQAIALSPFFMVDLVLPEFNIGRVGERVYVRFHHEPEPIAYRWLRKVRRLFLREFDV